jgi:hypothetical protein
MFCARTIFGSQLMIGLQRFLSAARRRHWRSIEFMKDLPEEAGGYEVS